MEKIVIFICSIMLIVSSSCSSNKNDKAEEIKLIDHKLDNWHQSAAEANIEDYLDFLSEDAIYIGTDSSERWSKDEFTQFCKPYFNKGTTWNFTKINRNINIEEDFAWFDETLKTQMGTCRASGVLLKNKQGWKLTHYHLSVTIRNDKLNEFLKIEQ